MDSAMRELIDRAGLECLEGKSQSRETMLALLGLDTQSEEAVYARKVANEVAHRINGGRGYIWGAVGLDLVPCTMDCSFCSFGSKWGLIDEEYVIPDDDVIDIARTYVLKNASFITLRTTEFYDFERLCELAKLVRDHARGDYQLVANTGELTVEQANELYDCGVRVAYHVLRLREGTDTPFDPEVRKATMRAISSSKLKLATNLEPVAAWHTDEELADRLEFLCDIEPYICGAGELWPVPGTPFENVETVSRERMYQIVATVRLCMSCKTPILCSPKTPEGFSSGANLACLDIGANPRDTKSRDREENLQIISESKTAFKAAGWHM